MRQRVVRAAQVRLQLVAAEPQRAQEGRPDLAREAEAVGAPVAALPQVAVARAVRLGRQVGVGRVVAAPVETLQRAARAMAAFLHSARLAARPMVLAAAASSAAPATDVLCYRAE